MAKVKGDQAMLTIFKGDDTGGTFGRPLHFTINTGSDVDLDGCRAEFEFDGIVKTFERIVAGASVEIVFTHQETADMKTGVRFAKFRIIDADGKIRTFDNSLAVKVTTHVGDAYPGSDSTSITIGNGISWSQVVNKPDLTDVRDLDPEASTMGDVMRTVNRLLSAFRACVAVVLMAVPALAEDAVEVLPLYAQLKDLPGKTQIMTNIVEYVATHGGSGSAGTDGQTVTNIVGGIVSEKLAHVPNDTHLHHIEDLKGFTDFSNSMRSKLDLTVYASTLPRIGCISYFDGGDGSKIARRGEVLGHDSSHVSISYFCDALKTKHATIEHDYWSGEATSVTIDGVMIVVVRDLMFGIEPTETDDELSTKSYVDGLVSHEKENIIAMIPNEEKLKDIAGDAMNSIWDEKLGITWRARMIDGNLYYIAVTNTNITAIK